MGAENSTPIHVTFLAMDRHLAGPVTAAAEALRPLLPGLRVTYHAASDWDGDDEALDAVNGDISEADIIVAGMLFLETHFKPVLPALKARAPHCDAIAGCLSAPDIVKLTRLGRFRMDKPASGPIALLKRLRGKGGGEGSKAGASQTKLLRRLPKILKFIPGTAQDVRSYFLALQYWLAGDNDNIRNLIVALINRYAADERTVLQNVVTAEPPIDYPDTGVYHPRMSPTVGRQAKRLPLARATRPTVGVLVMRSYVLADDAAHYNGVIEALEAQGMKTVPAFASGLDARPAIEQFFMRNGEPIVDAVVSLTGFSLIGGPAYNDSEAAVETLKQLNVPYVTAHALEFQPLPNWGQSTAGLSPVESTMMVAIPELDGATSAMVFGGRAGAAGTQCTGCDRQCDAPDTSLKQMQSCPERAERLALRVRAKIDAASTPRADRKIATVLFNFPPNSGATGSAAYLGVYESLFNLLHALKADGYTVDLPASVDELREQIIKGNADQYGADANVAAKVSVADHVATVPRLTEIEKQWGPAPGRHQTDGRTIHIYGAHFGNVFVGIQPAFGYEGDPMRLLFEGGFAPTHAFAAFYQYIHHQFGANAIVHFGTHGALEFMPGKQTGMSGKCWPDSLIADTPHYYFYAANNPSEAAIAKRRAGATTISYLTPAVTEAALYKGLADLKSTLDRWRATDPADGAALASLALLAQAQASELDLAAAEPPWDSGAETQIAAIRIRLLELEETLIPNGLHVAGAALSDDMRADLLRLSPPADGGAAFEPAVTAALAAGSAASTVASRFDLTDRAEALSALEDMDKKLRQDTEIPALLAALDGEYIPPVPGGDVITRPEILPTGRNIHGFDPFKMPSAYAVQDGATQAEKLIARHVADTGALPETVAIVLWGTDNLKSEGAQVAQAMALIGAKPKFDHYGRLTGTELIPLTELGRPRIDVIATLSGIFRDLLPMQTRMLASAALTAANAAEEPEDQNFVRKHAMSYQEKHGCDLQTAALRVFSNADGAYGSNVNQLVDSGVWDDGDELAEAYTNRKCFAYGVTGEPAARPELLDSILGDVDLAYQNLESVELGITTIDHYFDTLGGIGRAAQRAQGSQLPVYIGDQTRGDGKVRTLKEQVALETRTRTLNPKWYEGMLKHGYEGVRQIEAQVTHTLGWSATTGDVAPWVYQEISKTFVLDKELRDRLSSLNAKACARVANRLLEASDRNFWQPDPETLEALRQAGEELDDRVEGILPAEGVMA